MKWEKEFALLQRKVNIDEYIINNAISTTTGNLNSYFNEYGLPYKAISNGTSFIKISELKDIKIEKREDGVYVIASSLDTDYIHAEIKAVDGMYEITYYNGIDKTIKTYDLDEKMINKVIGNILFQEEKEEI